MCVCLTEVNNHSLLPSRSSIVLRPEPGSLLCLTNFGWHLSNSPSGPSSPPAKAWDAEVPFSSPQRGGEAPALQQQGATKHFSSISSPSVLGLCPGWVLCRGPERQIMSVFLVRTAHGSGSTSLRDKEYLAQRFYFCPWNLSQRETKDPFYLSIKCVS